MDYTTTVYDLPDYDVSPETFNLKVLGSSHEDGQEVAQVSGNLEDIFKFRDRLAQDQMTCHDFVPDFLPNISPRLSRDQVVSILTSRGWEDPAEEDSFTESFLKEFGW